MTALGGSSIVEFPKSPVGTSFMFKGSFGDFNRKQTFRIFHPDGTHTDFDFKHIKSLRFSTCTPIQPNRSAIIAEPCRIQSFDISFPNLQWKTEFENPPLCFGSITTYEYLLPSGWQLTTQTGTTTSNGFTWIQANNNVIVTTDATTGNGLSVQIRAINTSCGSGLVAGPIVSIPISRPKPTLSFSGQNPLCNSATFTANNVPSWVRSTLWEVTPSSLVNIGNPNANPTTFTKQNSGVGDLQFTISGGTTCPVSFTYNTQEILNALKLEVGTPIVAWPEVMYPTGGCLPVGFNVVYTTSSQFSAYFEWGYYEGPSSMQSPLVLVNGAGTTQQAIRIQNALPINRISVRGGNICGLGIVNIREFEFNPNCFAGPDVELGVYIGDKPAEMTLEPAKFTIIGNVVLSVLSLQIPFSEQRLTILISDTNGRVLKTLPVNNTHVEVDVSSFSPGVYMVTLIGKAKRETLRFIKQ